MTLRRIPASIGGKLLSVNIVGEPKDLALPCLGKASKSCVWRTLLSVQGEAALRSPWAHPRRATRGILSGSTKEACLREWGQPQWAALRFLYSFLGEGTVESRGVQTGACRLCQFWTVVSSQEERVKVSVKVGVKVGVKLGVKVSEGEAEGELHLRRRGLGESACELGADLICLVWPIDSLR